MFEYMIDGKQYRDDPQMIYDRLVIECNGDPGALADQVNADDSPMLAARGRLKIDEVIRAVFRLPPPNAGGPGWDQTMRLWNQFWTYSDQKKKAAGHSPISSVPTISGSETPAGSVESTQPTPSSG